MLVVWTTLFFIPFLCKAQFQRTSMYTESQVHNIQNHCTDEILKTTKLASKTSCGMSCSVDSECRRFLFCSLNSTCTLYQDGTDCVMSGDSTSCTCFRKKIGCHETTCTCPLGYYGDNCQNVAQDCNDAFQRQLLQNAGNLPFVFIQPDTAASAFEVVCSEKHTVLMERRKDCGDQNFNRSLIEYKEGFLQDRYNHWLGLDKFPHLLPLRQIHFLINVFDESGTACNFYLYMDGFYSRDSLRYDVGGSLTNIPFSTYDADLTDLNKCPDRMGGGWWFENNSECATDKFAATANHVWAGVNGCSQPKRIVIVMNNSA